MKINPGKSGKSGRDNSPFTRWLSTGLAMFWVCDLWTDYPHLRLTPFDLALHWLLAVLGSYNALAYWVQYYQLKRRGDLGRG